MIYIKSTLNTSELLKASSDAGFDTCTFMYLVYLMHLFKVPTMLRLPSATPEKELNRTNTKSTYFRQAFALFFFYYKHNEPGLNRSDKFYKTMQTKKGGETS